MASAATVAGWRAPAAIDTRSRGTPATGRPGGASAVSSTPAALTAATSPKASSEPAVAASAPIPGPATDPAESRPITMPDSRPRRPGGALSVTHDIDAVHTDPLATPCTNRARISTAAFGAQAKITVATVISTAEARVIRRAPTLGTNAMQPSDTTGTDAG